MLDAARRSSGRPSLCGTPSGAPCIGVARRPGQPAARARGRRARGVRRAAARPTRRCAPRLDAYATPTSRLRRRAVRRRARPPSSRTRSSAGTAGGRQADRAARRPGPAVHPDQRHPRRRTRRVRPLHRYRGSYPHRLGCFRPAAPGGCSGLVSLLHVPRHDGPTRSFHSCQARPSCATTSGMLPCQVGSTPSRSATDVVQLPRSRGVVADASSSRHGGPLGGP